jgi:hypothetical protein
MYITEADMPQTDLAHSLRAGNGLRPGSGNPRLDFGMVDRLKKTPEC